MNIENDAKKVPHRASLKVEEEVRIFKGGVNGIVLNDRQLGFYAAYHSNKVNQAIHFVCIPMILWYDTSIFEWMKLMRVGVH